MKHDPTKGQPLANLGRVIAEPPVSPSLFREACERIGDMLRQQIAGATALVLRRGLSGVRDALPSGEQVPNLGE